MELIDKYDRSLARISVINRSTKDGKRADLVIAILELIPREFPKFNVPRPVSQRVDTGKIFSCSFKMSIEEGMEWYSQVADNDFCMPGTKDRIYCGPFEKELSDLWSCLSLEQESRPFVPFWMQSPRVTTLVPVEPVDLWSENKDVAVLNFLKDNMFFDISAHRELIGTVHLLAPNPLIRSLTFRVVDEHTVVVNAKPRKDESLDDLTLVLEKLETDTICDHVEKKMAEEVRISVGNLSSCSLKVLYKRKYTLYWQPSAVFVKSIVVNSSIGSGTKSVFTKRGEYIIGLITKSSTISIGQESRDGMNRLRQAKLHRGVSRFIRTQMQTIMSNEEESRGFIRDQISRASRRVVFIDSYFGSDDFMEFAVATSGPHVVVKILTSSMFLKNEIEIEGRITNQGHLLGKAQGSLNYQSIGNIEIRVLSGKSPYFHDRFILIDDDLWLSGNSLNNIGARLSVIIKLQDTDDLLKAIETNWNEPNTITLEEWLKVMPKPCRLLKKIERIPFHAG